MPPQPPPLVATPPSQPLPPPCAHPSTTLRRPLLVSLSYSGDVEDRGVAGDPVVLLREPSYLVTISGAILIAETI